MTALAPGTIVGETRWPYDGAHPDCWTRPWSGVVLAQDDPDAWTGTIAFPERPEPDALARHLDYCRSFPEGLVSVPVRWEFGRVYWTRPRHLRPYAEDLALWEAARAAAYDREPIGRVVTLFQEA